jgi:hypothetical protein
MKIKIEFYDKDRRPAKEIDSVSDYEIIEGGFLNVMGKGNGKIYSTSGVESVEVTKD